MNILDKLIRLREQVDFDGMIGLVPLGNEDFEMGAQAVVHAISDELAKIIFELQQEQNDEEN